MVGAVGTLAGTTCDTSFDLSLTASSLSEFMGVIAGITFPTALLLVQYRRQTEAAARPFRPRSLVLLPVLTVAALASAYQNAVIAGDQDCTRSALLGVVSAPTVAFVVVASILLLAALYDEFEVDDRSAAFALHIVFAGTLAAVGLSLTVNVVDALQTAGEEDLGMAQMGWVLLPVFGVVALSAVVRDAYRNSAAVAPEWRRDHPFFRLFMLIAGAIAMVVQLMFGLLSGVTVETAEDISGWFVDNSLFVLVVHSATSAILLGALTMAYPRLLTPRSPRSSTVVDAVLKEIAKGR